MQNKSRAFTLIELLVVVLIIGILAAVAVPQYQTAVEKSRATEALVWTKHLAEAEELYYMANGEYTNDLSKLGITVPSNDHFVWGAAVDPSVYNVRLMSTNGGYVIRYFMKHLPSTHAEYQGRFLCVAPEENKKGTALCRSLSGTTGEEYTFVSGSKMYPLN